MCTIKFTIEFNIFQINDTGITIKNICEKCEQIFKVDDASVSFLDDSPARHLPSKALIKFKL